MLDHPLSLKGCTIATASRTHQNALTKTIRTGDLDENQLFKLKLNFSDPESPENEVMFKRHAFNFCQFMSTTNRFPPSLLWDLSISNDDFIGKQSSAVIASRFECEVNDRPKSALSSTGWPDVR